MATFIHAIAVVSALCLGICAVALFFTFLGYLKSLLKGKNRQVFIGEDYLKKGSLVSVHLREGRVFEKVKFLGYVEEEENEDRRRPAALSRMTILEDTDGAKIFIPSHTIIFIKETPPDSAAA